MTWHFHKYPDALASRLENLGGKLDILAPRHPDTFENAKYLHPGVFGNWINDPLDSLLNDETAADQKLETKALLEIIPAGEATILYLKNCQIDVADSGDCESVRS